MKFFKRKSWLIQNKKQSRDFPGGPVVETALPVQGAEVQSLVRELTFHMPWYAAKKVKKKKKSKVETTKQVAIIESKRKLIDLN